MEWTRIVEEYSALKLTYESDRLPAIAAIVLRVMRIRQGNTYIAGMWKDALIPDLFWHLFELQDRPCRTNRIPTWSWASASGAVQHFIEGECLVRVVQLIDVTFTSAGVAHMGQVEDASITLQGPACPLPNSAYPGLRESVLAKSFEWEESSSTPDVSCTCHFYMDFDWQSVQPHIRSNYDLTVLFLCEQARRSVRLHQCYGAVLLQPVGNNAFERVGFLITQPAFEPWEDQSTGEKNEGADSNEESSHEGGSDGGHEYDEEADDKIIAHEEAVFFSVSTRQFAEERIEAKYSDIRDDLNESDGDGLVSSFVRALPVQTSRIV